MGNIAIERITGTWSKTLSIFLLAALLSPTGRGEIIPPDRLVPWEAGVPGGIPHRTDIFCNVRESIPGSTEIAQGDGVTDDSSAINTAISLCPAGKVVYIPAGTYKVTNRFTFNNKNNITIRGDGPGNTILKSYAGSTFYFGASEYNIPPSRIMNITSGFTKGSTSITVDGIGEGIAVGKLLHINQLNDTTLVNNTGSKGSKSTADRDRNGTRVMTQMVKVTAINGNTISISPPLYWTYKANLDPEATIMYYRITGVGFEDFTIRAGAAGANGAFFLDTADACWVKNVEMDHLGALHMTLYFSINCEIRDSYFHHVYNDVYTVGTGYGIETFNCSGTLIENNLFNYMRVPLFINHGSSGNVIGYNYSINQRDTDPANLVVTFSACHGAHPMMNLWEGNVCAELQADYYRGSSSHMTLFRNHFRGTDTTILSNRKAVALDRYQLYYNIVGNVLGVPEVNNWVYEPTQEGIPYGMNVIYRLGYPHVGNNNYGPNPDALDGFDSRVASTLIRHGNYDYSTQSVIWDSSINDNNIPDSLYLAGKPPWWGNLRWPAIGPDLSPRLSAIPAQRRYELILSGDERVLERPEGLRRVP